MSLSNLIRSLYESVVPPKIGFVDKRDADGFVKHLREVGFEGFGEGYEHEERKRYDTDQDDLVDVWYVVLQDADRERLEDFERHLKSFTGQGGDGLE